MRTHGFWMASPVGCTMAFHRCQPTVDVLEAKAALSTTLPPSSYLDDKATNVDGGGWSYIRLGFVSCARVHSSTPWGAAARTHAA